jgi:hypothetical protein
MTVYVDGIKNYTLASVKPEARAYGTRWAHMIADTDEELHQFARALGLTRRSFQTNGNPALSHYDLVPSKHILAKRLGAVHLSEEDFRAILARRVQERHDTH